jgi:hypothetical protein
LKIKSIEDRKVLEDFQNRKNTHFDEKRLLNKALKSLISKLKLKEANTKIKLIESETRKKNYYHYQHHFSSFHIKGFCISEDYKG